MSMAREKMMQLCQAILGHTGWLLKQRPQLGIGGGATQLGCCYETHDP